MTTATLVADAYDYVLGNLPDYVGDVKVAEGPFALEDFAEEMVVLGDATIDAQARAFAGEGGAMIRNETTLISLVVYVRRDGPDDPQVVARQRAIEILGLVDNFLRNDKTLGGLVVFSWLRPKALHKAQAPDGVREAYFVADIEYQGVI